MDTFGTDEHFMQMALHQAYTARDAGEVPVGAVLTREGKVLGRASNQVELLKDPTAHAEMIAITQAAGAVGDWRLSGTTLFVTKEPCPMCAGALVLARVSRVVWGVDDPERGGGTSQFQILNHPRLNHRCEVVTGVCAEDCRTVLVDFFRKLRERN